MCLIFLKLSFELEALIGDRLKFLSKKFRIRSQSQSKTSEREKKKSKENIFVPEVPSFVSFNHLITTLSDSFEFRIVFFFL